MKNILVTGTGGIIGSHLTELLVENGYYVKDYDHYNSSNEWGWLDSSAIKNKVQITQNYLPTLPGNQTLPSKVA